MCLLECAAQTLILKVVVTLEVDNTNTHLGAAVDVEVYIHALLIDRVVRNAHIYLASEKTLLGVVLLDELHILVDDIVRELGVAAQLEHLLLQILRLGLRYARDCPVEDAGTLLEEHLEVYGVTLDSSTNLNVGEVAGCPEACHGVGDKLAGQIYRVALLQACRRLKDVVVEVLNAVEVDFANVVKLAIALGEHWGVEVEIYRVGNLVIRYIAKCVACTALLRLGNKCCREECHKGDQTYFE